MATILQHRRGNTAQTATFTGNAGEIFINTDTNQVVVQDGVTQGGWPIPVSSGYTPGGLLIANAAGVLQNTSPVQLVSANNTLLANSNLTITGNLSVLGTTTTVNQEIINTTEIIAGQLTANSGASSTSTTTGALLVTGGAGVTGNLNAGGTVSSNSVAANTVAVTSGITINSVPVLTQTQAILYSLILG